MRTRRQLPMQESHRICFSFAGASFMTQIAANTNARRIEVFTAAANRARRKGHASRIVA
jgi:hypothetical protein